MCSVSAIHIAQRQMCQASKSTSTHSVDHNAAGCEQFPGQPLAMTEEAAGQDVLERIACVKAEFQAVQEQLEACDTTDDNELDVPGRLAEVEQLREAVDVCPETTLPSLLS
eukprot:jgi/Ulvmu1/2470/UM136_0022.1